MISARREMRHRWRELGLNRLEAHLILKPPESNLLDQIYRKVWMDQKLKRKDLHAVLDRVMTRKREILDGTISVDQAVKDEINAFLAQKCTLAVSRS